MANENLMSKKADDIVPIEGCHIFLLRDNGGKSSYSIITRVAIWLPNTGCAPSYDVLLSISGDGALEQGITRVKALEKAWEGDFDQYVE